MENKDNQQKSRYYKIIPCTVPEKERIRQFEEFIELYNSETNHRRKIRRPFIEKDMRL